MFAHQRKKIRLLFAAADLILIVIAFQAAYYTRTQLTLERIFFLVPRTHILLLGFCAVAWVALGSLHRVYEYLDSANPRRVLGRTFRQSSFGIILLILFQYLLRLDPPLSRSFLLLFFTYSFFLLTAFRWYAPSFVSAFQRGFGSPYHVVIVGDEKKAAALGNLLAQGSPFRLKIVAQLGEEECIHSLPDLLASRIVDEVIFNVESGRLSELEEIFLHCDEQGVRTRVAIDFFPHVNSEITLDRVGGAPLLTFSAAPLEDVRLLVKRFLDVVISASALVILSPLIGGVAALIKLTSGGGRVIYSQERCGLNGRKFTMYKFRSMVENAEELRMQYEHLSHRTVAFKIRRDPRITPIGRWIRKFSIDEIPQLYNVLRGEMSIVGPRPPLPEEVERYELWQKRRLRMRPGLTCIWAVCGRDHIDFNSWMRMDISYIENWSLQLDWSIILRTIPHVLAGKGAN
ncbi:MAG TPA: sugar transferase [Bryobacteraceae bacterium]|nr:sugar transferase [Bryobacteraceae bacterium]